jgi:hypothetical protein
MAFRFRLAADNLALINKIITIGLTVPTAEPVADFNRQAVAHAGHT